MCKERERINCHHNFTQQETHYGKSVWVSRKGAIRAETGDPGLIPGSMGTASYVVEGLGNAASLNSSPHGAGREYSRKAARKTFSLDELKEAMHGIEFRATEAFMDEIPAAYKPIEQVMRDAAGPGQGAAPAAAAHQCQGGLSPKILGVPRDAGGMEICVAECDAA